MPKNKLRIAFITVLLYQLLLTACTVQPPRPDSGTISTSDQELKQLYKQARNATPPESETYRLQAAKLLISLDRLSEANNVFKSIVTFGLPNDVMIDYTLTGARLAVRLFENEEALALLNQNANLLANQPVSIQIEAAELRGNALLALDQNIGSAKEYIFIAPFLTEENSEQNKELIWSTLMKAQIEELQPHVQLGSFSDFQGWLEIVLLSKESLDNLDAQLQSLQDWTRRWPFHPAAKSLPRELAILATVITERPEKIVLMLPLTGKNSTAGKAIRDGFFSAFYAAKSTHSNTPTIHVIDTSKNTDFLVLYENAILESADLIIGPLQKKNVELLSEQGSLIVPTLALNYSLPQEDGQEVTTQNLYQFGLSAEDEARQVARRARQLGNKNTLILAPESAWGKRIEQAFSDEWTQLEGTLLEAQYFNDKTNYAQASSKLLNINESEQRKQRIRETVGGKVEFTPRPREDMDFIFIIATPKQARQIKPTLAFYYAGNTPVYSTSHIYSGKEDPLLDRDLDGITFSETPWMLNSSEKSLKHTVKRTWPSTADRFGRLYALGVDAYRLFPRLKQLILIPSSKINGETGSLTMNNYGRIIRELQWAKIRRGKIRRIQ